MRAPPPLRCRAGMTLIELMAVLAIMGVMLSVSVAALHLVTTNQPALEPALQELLAEARLLAAREGGTVHLEIGAQGRYRLLRGAERTLREGALPVQAVQPEPFILRIFPPGTSDGGTLQLRSRDGWHRFEIDRVTARPVAR